MVISGFYLKLRMGVFEPVMYFGLKKIKAPFVCGLFLLSLISGLRLNQQFSPNGQ